MEMLKIELLSQTASDEILKIIEELEFLEKFYKLEEISEAIKKLEKLRGELNVQDYINQIGKQRS